MLSVLCRIALAAALGAAVISAPARTVIAGDTNGDRAIDVLDLQALLAEAVAEGHSVLADVNGDGIVDVRDFQELLGQAQDSEREGTEFPRTDEPGAVLVAKPDLSSHRVEFRRMTVSSLLAEFDAPRHAQLYTEPASLPPPQVERYVLQLSPHAPPLGA